MVVPREQFEQSLSDSGLLSAEEVQALRRELEPPAMDSERFADALVQRQKLTPFQATCILDGQTEGLAFDEYVIVDKIGSGGMGDVYKARHCRMKRYVAVKVIAPKALESPGAVKRFHREVEAASKLEHPNIVMAFDAREFLGRHYLIMQYVDGPNLAALLKKHGALTIGQAVDIITQVARGLDYAHRRGVVHRDIKPSNLLLDSTGTVKILDMGLARVQQPHQQGDASGRDDLTNTGQVLGTADYMAPEQAANTHDADARSDIYSLGCTLYRLLTGEVPYQGDTAIQKILAHNNLPIPPLRDKRPVPDELEAIYQQMLAKNPDDRQQSMSEVLDQLESLAVSTPAGVSTILAQPWGPAVMETLSSESWKDWDSVETGDQPPKRQVPVALKSRWAMIGGAMALVAVIALAWVWGQRNENQTPAQGANNQTEATIAPKEPRGAPEGQPEPLASTIDPQRIHPVQAVEDLPPEESAQPADADIRRDVEFLGGTWTISDNTVGVAFDRKLDYSGVDDELLDQLADVQPLRQLRFRACPNVTATGFRSLASAVLLDELIVWSCELNEDDITAIASLQQISRLILRDNSLDDQRLSNLEALTKLRHLEITMNRDITVGGLDLLLQSMPWLERVTLDHQVCTRTGDEKQAFFELLERMQTTRNVPPVFELRRSLGETSPLVIEPPYPSRLQLDESFDTNSASQN